MRTRSLFTVLAFATVLAGAGAESAFADGGSGQPSASASTPPTTAPSGPSSAPTAVPSAPPTVDRSAAPSAAPTTSPQGGQIRAVPSGAPNTGVPTTSSNGHREAAAVGGSLAVLLAGSGTVVARRRLKGRG